MIYTELTKKAMLFAYKAHDGVLDKGGVPYVFHPFHVAEQMNTEYEVCVALMHDIVEDTEYTLEDIRNLGFPEEIVEAVATLTKPEDLDYMEYIEKVKKNPLATAVKLADLAHNSDETRMPVTSQAMLEKRQKLHAKYAKARDILTS